MVKGRNTISFGVRVSDELYKAVKREANKRKRSVSELVRYALEDFIQYRKPSDPNNWGRTNIYQGYNHKSTIPDNDTKREELTESKKLPKPKEKYPGTPRNAPCPCGALHPDGILKKYKHCCGKNG